MSPRQRDFRIVLGADMPAKRLRTRRWNYVIVEGIDVQDRCRYRGQIDAPSAAGNTATETVRTLGMVGKLHWTTVESVRPWRFVIETTSVEMPLMRRARLRIIYAFEPANERREHRTRLARTLEYKFTGLARFLDRIYLRGHLKQKAVLALTTLQRIVARGVADGTSSHAGK